MKSKVQENEDAVMAAIRKWASEHRNGLGPGFRDIATLSGLSLGLTYETCADLRSQGRISFENGVARSIRAVRR